MSSPPPAHKSKFVAALLAFLLGGVGAHALYLRRTEWWIYSAWLSLGMVAYTTWASKATTWILVIALLPVWIGFAESLGLALLADSAWDARHNAQGGKSSRNGWNCVLLAIVVLLVGTTVLMTAIILAAQFYFEARSVPLDR